jgi:hypothetical protein
MAPLPKRRVDHKSVPWQDVGADYCGPFSVLRERLNYRHGPTWKKPKKELEEEFITLHVCLFTCAVTRAVHLEYVTSLSTQQYFNALMRFIARRGMPSTISSDNGTQFKAASKEMKKLYLMIDWKRIQKMCIDLPQPIKFIFNPPIAPHRSGFVERMIGSTKRALMATLGRQRATYEEFRTLLCNVEAVINGRPLTSIGQDARDPLPITPSLLILGRSLRQLPDDLTRDTLGTKAAVMFKERGRLHSEFWGRYRKDYLAQLQIIQKWHLPQHAPRVGELVLMKDEAPCRMEWPMGIVLRTHVGRDGKVRSVDLQSNGKEVKRDIRQLYRLEEDSELE